jgi:hypothetical protein
LLRAEKTAEGMKGIYIPLTEGDLAAWLDEYAISKESVVKYSVSSIKCDGSLTKPA